MPEPVVVAAYDQLLAAARQWVANDPGHQADGLAISLQSVATVRKLDDASMTVVCRFAQLGLAAAILAAGQETGPTDA